MKKGLITSILVLTFGGMQAQPLPATPKLVVTLNIDQLRTDYLEAFSSLYGEKGFKRLMLEGKVFCQAEMPFSKPDRASATATLFTGCPPATHGIIAGKWMDMSTLTPRSCVDDPNYMGNYTNQSSSPAQLLTSTVADELKIATRNNAKVYAIAPYRDAAILSAGHAADGAFWLNNKNGKWCSTTYYQEFPEWLNQYNDSCSVDFRIKDIVWTPLRPVADYKYLSDWRTEPFKYIFEAERENKFYRLSASPFVNDEVNLLAARLLEKSGIGRDGIPDLLALTYYAGNYNHRSTRECAMEMQDTYIRLDRSIATLLELIDKQVGLQNTIVCITSTGYADPEPADTGIYRIPGGEFHLNRCATLLNMYLMATYGAGQYVEAYYDQQIYLNHKLLEDKQLDLTDILEKSAAFLVQFSGVDKVYTSHQLLLGSWSPQIDPVRNSYHRKRSGDLAVEVLPGWTIVQDNGADSRVVRSAETPAPLILMGGGIKADIIRTPVSTDRIAPTLTKVMRIRAPNGCKASPLNL